MTGLESIKESVDFIEESLNEDINLDKLAKRAFLSKYYYHRLFHSIMGEPVMEYVRRRRLLEAAKDLSHTEERIVDIALRYQFSSQEAFIRAFKNMFGIAPGQYRKDNGVIALVPRVKVKTTPIIRTGGTMMRLAA